MKTIDNGAGGSVIRGNLNDNFTEIDGRLELLEDTQLTGNLNDLDDVDISGIASNKILKWDGVYEKWVIADDVGEERLQDLTDVDISAAQVGQSLVKQPDGTWKGQTITGGEGGTTETVNVETLTGNKTLDVNSDVIQILDGGSADRTIYLPTAQQGLKFVIVNNTFTTTWRWLKIYYGGTEIYIVTNGQRKTFVSSGTSWYCIENINSNLVLGYRADGFDYAVSLGGRAMAKSSSVASGYLANAEIGAVAIGRNSNAGNNAIAIGQYANTGNNPRSIAKGQYSVCSRYGEEWRGASDNNQFGYGLVNYFKITTTSTAQEIYINNNSGSRFTMSYNSSVTFKIKGNCFSGDTNYNGWEITGVAVRGSGSVIVTLYENNKFGTSNTKAISVTGTSGYISITITPNVTTQTYWSLVFEYAESRA